MQSVCSSYDFPVAERIFLFNDLIRLALRHGLAVFVISGSTWFKYRNLDFSLAALLSSSSLIARHDNPISRGIAAQLLALGYGRPETHPVGVPLLEPRLDATRLAAVGKTFASGSIVSTFIDEEKKRELLALVDRFDAGPLSLLRLARIAVRRSVAGKYFALHIRALIPLMPAGSLCLCCRPDGAAAFGRRACRKAFKDVNLT